MINDNKLIRGDYCGLGPESLVKLGLSQLLLFQKNSGNYGKQIAGDISAYRAIIRGDLCAKFLEWKKEKIREGVKSRGPSDFANEWGL